MKFSDLNGTIQQYLQSLSTFITAWDWLLAETWFKHLLARNKLRWALVKRLCQTFFFWLRSGLRNQKSSVSDRLFRVVCFRWIKGNYAKANLFTFISGLDKLRAKREPWIRYSLARNELRIALEFRFSGRAIVQILGHICRHMKWLTQVKQSKLIFLLTHEQLYRSIFRSSLLCLKQFHRFALNRW